MPKGDWGDPPSPTDFPDDWSKKPANGVEAVTKDIAALSTKQQPATPAKEEEDAADPSLGGDSGEPEASVQVTLAEGGSAALYTGVSTFEALGLRDELLKGIYSMGYTKPSKIQEKALPLLLSDPPKNMIGQSQAGTGKTAAFALTMLSRVKPEERVTQAICLAPARELAVQIMENLKDMGKYTNVTTQLAVRDAVKRGEKVSAQIVVGTPGTVADLIRKRSIDPSRVCIFVLDEADNMLDLQGLGDQSIRIKNAMPKDGSCQLVLFSATFTPELREFATRFAPGANEISLKREELSVDGIKQFYMDCKDEGHKVEVLTAIYGLLTIGQSIIFVRTRRTADEISRRMNEQGHSVGLLHGKLEVYARLSHACAQAADRDTVMKDFRDGKFKVLVTTNVLSRGIDILQVTLVINFDMPLDVDMKPDPETYLHRIGRTGRFGRTGVSINFVHNDSSFREMKAIETHFGREIVRVPTDDTMEIESILKKAVK
ncbi:MAG: hypothetical protein SGCHY_003101 [Lobulomycetales sp.]